MKRVFFIFILLMSGIFNLVFADDFSGLVLPSEVAVVESVIYLDGQTFSEQETLKQDVTVRLLSGNFKGTRRIIENMITGNPAYDMLLKKGDKVILHAEPLKESVATPEDVDFYIADIKRDNSIAAFSVLFAGLLIFIGRKKGVNSIISILATVALIFFVMVPLVLLGICPILCAILVGILSTLITIYLVGGFNSKSTSAIIGTGVSLIFAGILSVLAIIFAHLTGFGGEENMFLYSARPDLSFKGILAASIIIAALGALMDTAVSIASAINEIYQADNSLSKLKLFQSGMNVGKDIIGTMSNTLILVYLGASLPLVLLSNNIDLNKFFNLNHVASEILSALIGSIAILVCVPVTAFVASNLISKKKSQEVKLDKIDIL